MVHHTAPAPVIVGLPNLSNTCYINSVLQSLYHSAHFNSFLSNYAHPINFLILFTTNNSTNIKHVYIRFLQKLKGQLPKDFHLEQQNDAQEFLMILIDTFYETVKSSISPQILSGYVRESTTESCILNRCRSDWLSQYSPVQEVVYYQLLRSIKCPSCSHVVTSIEKSSNLYVQAGPDGIETSIRTHFCPSRLDDWKCDKCMNSNNEISCYITKLPKLFIICIKQFSNDCRSKIKKIQVNKIPHHLDLRPYTLLPNENTRYTLSSAIDHVGTLHYGHYFTRVLSETNQVITIDDESVRVSKDDALYDTNSYILFYEQR